VKPILAPIDFSPVSHSVVDEAAVLSRATGGRVVVMNVTHPPMYIPDDYGISEVVDVTIASSQSAVKHIRQLKAELHQKGLDVDIVHIVGNPATAILEHSRKIAAGYIVMGSHGHTALYDLAMGSTTHVILKRAPCPVLVVPAAPANGVECRKSRAEARRQEARA
jgi:nucleotide-binding universal stress UspA family protein